MKKIIFFSGLFGTVILYVLFHSRETGLCKINCGDWIGQYQNVFLFFPILFIFSIFTLRLDTNVFNYWWKFARVAIPIILIVSIGINLQLHHRSSGFLNLDDMFDIPAHILMYAIFIFGSLIQIWRGYKQK